VESINDEVMKSGTIPPFSEVVEFHGHVYPGIIFGYLMSVRAMRELSMGDADEFTVISETGR